MARAEQPKAAHPPRWMLVLAPLAALVVSCTDVIVLLSTRPRGTTSELRLALLCTVPLGLGAYVWTLWVVARLRREVVRRVRSESDLRSALVDRETALAESAQALERERLLRRELDHRVRNNLAALMGLVGVYEDTGRAPGSFAEALRGKIAALREVYGLISLSGPGGVDLGSLLRTMADALLPAGSLARFTASGPGVRLLSREASAMAIIAQELFTNSLKHGALRAEGGAVRVAWDAGERQRSRHRLVLRWRESPVPARPAPAERVGAGLSLIRGFAEGDLRGHVTFELTDDAWVVELEAGATPADHAAAEPRAPQETAA